MAHGTRRFNALSWAESTQLPALIPISSRSVLILSSHLRLGLPKGLFPVGLQVKFMKALLSSSILVDRRSRVRLSALPYEFYADENYSILCMDCAFLYLCTLSMFCIMHFSEGVPTLCWSRVREVLLLQSEIRIIAKVLFFHYTYFALYLPLNINIFYYYMSKCTYLVC